MRFSNFGVELLGAEKIVNCANSACWEKGQKFGTGRVVGVVMRSEQSKNRTKHLTHLTWITSLRQPKDFLSNPEEGKIFHTPYDCLLVTKALDFERWWIFVVAFYQRSSMPLLVQNLDWVPAKWRIRALWHLSFISLICWSSSSSIMIWFWANAGTKLLQILDQFWQPPIYHPPPFLLSRVDLTFQHDYHDFPHDHYHNNNPSDI